MKIMLILAGLWFGLNTCAAEDQIVKSPFLDYYKFTKSGDSLGDGEPHYSPQTQVYYFQFDFTGDGHKSIFITDDQSQQGPHGIYGWLIYYPIASDSYQKIPIGISMSKNGPDYIGYIDQIKRNGIILGEKYSVAAYYLDKGSIKSQAIDLERGHANSNYYPKYFSTPTKWQIQKTTLAQIAQKYANPNPTNAITPAAK